MDLKLTKKRINEHLAYDWTKYLAVIFVCIFVVTLFYVVSARRMNDKEEFNVTLYGRFTGKLDPSYENYLAEITKEYDSEYVSTVVNYYASRDDVYSEQAASAKIEATFKMAPDVLILPVLDGLIGEDGNLKGTYFEENNSLKYGAAFTFDFRVGKNYFIPVDEVIESELKKGNPAAIELKAMLDAHPEFYYNSQRVAANDEDPYHPYNQIGNNGEQSNFGINLNKLDVSKTSKLISDELLLAGEVAKECKYVVGIKRDSQSHAEAICFLNWFVKQYS